LALLLLASGEAQSELEEVTMNWQSVEGQWKQVRAQLKSKWAKLTDDDLKNLEAKREAIAGKLQERYGIVKDDAERQLDSWINTLTPERTKD
jgi:uncharacterized protein YjbJ (UPF0337 family)